MRNIPLSLYYSLSLSLRLSLFVSFYFSLYLYPSSLPVLALSLSLNLYISLRLSTAHAFPYLSILDSKHPPPIMKNLPKSIQSRLYNNSVNEETFKKAAGPYNTAPKENGQNYTLNDTPNHTRHEHSKAYPKNERIPSRAKAYSMPKKK